MPFRISRGLILVEATVGAAGRPLTLLLDSGAGETLLSTSTAIELGLALSGQEKIRTVDGTRGASRAGTVDFRLGGKSKFTSHPLVVDLTRESRTLGSRLDGLLGADFFQNRTIQLDFRNSRLRLSPDGKPAAGAARLPLTVGNSTFYVTLSAGGSQLKRVRLDTGCNRTLCWTPSTGAPALRFWSDGRPTKVDVSLGDFTLADLPTDIYRVPLFAQEDGLLGTGLLCRFDSVWIDAEKGRVIFESGRN